MNLSQLKRTIRTDLRRAVHILPATLLYTLLFLLVSLVIIMNGEHLFFNPNKYEQVPVGLYMPNNDENDAFGYQIMEDMKSFRETLDIRILSSEEEGTKALENGDITALILIPDNFVGTVLTGGNDPVRILFKGNDTLEEHIINDLLLNSADMLGTAQAAQYAILMLNRELGLDSEAAASFAQSVNSSNFTYVLTRENLFESKAFDDLAGLPLTKQLAGGYTLLVLSFLCFILTAFYQGKKEAYRIRQRGCGVGRFGIACSEWISTVFLLYASYLVIFTGLLISGLNPKFTSLLLILPILFCIGAFILFLSYSSRNTVYANLVILVGIILLMYISGGLIPIDFLPKFLQNLSHWNPITGLIHLMQTIMF